MTNTNTEIWDTLYGTRYGTHLDTFAFISTPKERDYRYWTTWVVRVVNEPFKRLPTEKFVFQ